MNKVRCLVFVGAFVILSTSFGRTQEKKITVMPVNYEGLKQEILKHRGKVVIVDFWATNCGPCRKNFHKFVKMSKDHENKGIAVISVSLDTVERDGEDDAGFRKLVDERRAAIDKFLNDEQATMRNLWLDDAGIVWSQKLGATSIPCYFVFDRHGRWVRFNGDSINYDEIEKTALRMAQEK